MYVTCASTDSWGKIYWQYAFLKGIYENNLRPKITATWLGTLPTYLDGPKEKFWKKNWGKNLVWPFWSPWKINKKNGLAYCFTYSEPKKAPRLYKLAPLWSSPLLLITCFHESSLFSFKGLTLFLYFGQFWPQLKK